MFAWRATHARSHSAWRRRAGLRTSLAAQSPRCYSTAAVNDVSPATATVAASSPPDAARPLWPGYVCASLSSVSGVMMSLGIFFLCVWIVHGIVIYGEDERARIT